MTTAGLWIPETRLGSDELGEALGEGVLRVLRVDVLLEAGVGVSWAASAGKPLSSQRLLRRALEGLLADVALDRERGLGALVWCQSWRRHNSQRWKQAATWGPCSPSSRSSRACEPTWHPVGVSCCVREGRRRGWVCGVCGEVADGSATTPHTPRSQNHSRYHRPCCLL